MATKTFQNTPTADLWALLAELESESSVNLPYTQKLIGQIRDEFNRRSYEAGYGHTVRL